MSGYLICNGCRKRQYHEDSSRYSSDSSIYSDDGSVVGDGLSNNDDTNVGDITALTERNLKFFRTRSPVVSDLTRLLSTI